MPLPPNILVVSIESIDGRALSCLGFPGALTPELDRLATEGVIFRNAYCPAPICSPSRAATWTGRDCHRIGAWNNFTGHAENEPAMDNLLAAAGYRTGDLGRRDRRPGRHSLKGRILDWTRASGIDLPVESPHRRRDVPGEVGYPWDWENLRGERPFDASMNLRQWLDDAAARRQPFFLHYGIGAVHTGGGYAAAQACIDRIDTGAVRLPPWHEPAHPALAIQARRKNRTARLPDAEVLASRRNYLAAILEADAMIGWIRGELARTGLDRSTVLIVHGDHGDMQLEHGHQWAKNNGYEASARVPLIVQGPGVVAGRDVAGPVSLVDLLPTVLDLAGAPPARSDGHSLAGVLAGGADGHPHAVLCQYHGGHLPTGMFLWRRGPWKLVVYAGLAPQLFNLADDPDELDDLAARRPDEVARLEGELRAHVDWPAVDAAVKAQDLAMFRSWWLGRAPDEREEGLARVFGSYAPFTAADRERILAWAGLHDALTVGSRGSTAAQLASR